MSPGNIIVMRYLFVSLVIFEQETVKPTCSVDKASSHLTVRSTALQINLKWVGGLLCFVGMKSFELT